MIVIEKEVFRLYLPMDEKKLVKVQGCSHKRNARREYKRVFEGLRQKIQTEYIDTLN